MTFPSFVHPHIDLRVAVFTAFVAVASGILLGLAPAMHGRVSRLTDALKESARGSEGTRARTVRSALVVAEVSLAVLLLVGAGLMIRTVQHIVAIDPGFNPDRVLVARVSIPRQATSSSSTARPRLSSPRARCSIGSARCLASPPPALLRIPRSRDSIQRCSTRRKGMQRPTRRRARVRTSIASRRSSLHDRDPVPQRPDVPGIGADARPRAVVVSEHVATRFWPGQDPIGKRIKLGNLASQNPWLTIVGVVGEVKYRGLPENPTADPDLLFPVHRPRATGVDGCPHQCDPASLVPSVRQAIRDVDPGIPLFGVFTMAERIADQTAQFRFTTWVLGTFAAMALILSAIGIYGVMSYLVSQRTREVGIRMALGATRREIVRLIVGRGARLIGAGILIGAVASLGLQRLMSVLIYQASILDGVTAAAIAALAAAGLLACYLPALRASRVDPLVALRTE